MANDHFSTTLYESENVSVALGLDGRYHAGEPKHQPSMFSNLEDEVNWYRAAVGKGNTDCRVLEALKRKLYELETLLTRICALERYA